MTVRRGAMVVVAACACGGPSGPTRPAVPVGVEPGLELAVYTAGTTAADARGQGFAMVVDRRHIELARGVAEVAFTAIPDTVDPGSVWFRSFTDPRGTKVLEQSFDYDGADLGALVREQIGREVVLVRRDGELRGVLAHVAPAGYVLDVGGGKQVTVPADRALLGVRLPSGQHVSLRPTLQWTLESARGGDHLVEVAYSAHRVSWWASYTAVVDLTDPAATTVDLSVWATVANDSSFRFEDATVRLVAGEAGAVPGAPARTAAETTAAAWVWPVEHPVTLDAHSTRQLQLFPPREAMPARVELRYEGMPESLRAGIRTDQYYGSTSQPRVDTALAVAGDQQLPAGSVQVFMRRAGVDEPVLVSRSQIAATRAGKEATIPLGPADRVTGSRRQLGFNYDFAAKQVNEAFEVKIDNQRDEVVRVIVIEDLYRGEGGAQVVNASPKPLSQDGKRVTFALEVPAHGSATARYEAIYKGVSDTVNR